MDYTIHTIDNLFNSQPTHNISTKFIYQTIINSVKNEGLDIYSQKEINSWLSRRSLEEVEEGIKTRFFIYIKESNGDISAFAAINKSNGKYYYSWLQVLPEYRGKGYSHLLSNERDNYIQLRGINKIIIESLKFENTLNFHNKRGFKTDINQDGLTETVRMYKEFS